MNFEDELDIYLRAHFTLLVVVTHEEERLLQKIKILCERSKRGGLAWDAAEGFQVLAGRSLTAPTARDPLTALEQIDKADGGTLFVLKDFHESWGNAQIKRKLRSVAQRLKFTRKTIPVTSPTPRSRMN